MEEKNLEIELLLSNCHMASEVKLSDDLYGHGIKHVADHFLKVVACE
jgi:hypothetical protein